MVATNVRADHPPGERTNALEIEDAFIAAVVMREGYFRDNWLDDRPLGYEPPQKIGAVSLMDLRHRNHTRFKSPIESIQFYFPRSTLNVIAESNGLKRIDELHTPISRFQEDNTFEQLARSLRLAFDRPAEISQVFLNHMLIAAGLHLLVRHGDAEVSKTVFRGGLAPWQQKRVEEMLDASLDGNLSLSDMADACRLSPRHFARAFSETNGMPPHRWILQRRVDRAKDLLLSSNAGLADIASACFFANQSHFTRVFTQAVGESPGAWRRIRRD
jgi:AraC-like DNA-binding protein